LGNELYELYEFKEDNISFFFTKINDSFNTNLELLRAMKNDCLISINNIANYFDLQNIFSEFKITLPFNPIDVIKQMTFINKLYKETTSEEIFFILQICRYFILEESISYLTIKKEKIDNLKIPELINKNKIKNNLINTIKSKIPENIKIDLLSQVWNNINNSTKIVEDNDKLNYYILNYVKKSNKTKFKEDLVFLIKDKIKGINLGVNDPQNLFLKPFMKQNNLDFQEI
jgi:hypothetical protein